MKTVRNRDTDTGEKEYNVRSEETKSNFIGDRRGKF